MSGPERLATVVVCGHDEATLDLLCKRLAEDRFEPLPAGTTEEALRLCRHHLPDLLVVDFDLPDGAGPELLRRIREAHWLKTRIDPYLPVLVLRPRDGGPEDCGPDLVADDLLDKPFTYEDLRSRIEAILRRRHGRLDRPVRVGELLVDPGRRKVIVGDREVRLAKKEFTLLRVLASDPTRVFAKEELLRDVWGLRGPATSARTLDSHASRLRRKLDPEGRRFVLNCWGIGYRLVDSVEETELVSGGGGEDR
jgi:DNA-binding response OmpR family regulator